MEYLVYIALAYIIWSVFRQIQERKKDNSGQESNAGRNAILVEHFLDQVELVEENPFSKELGDKIVEVFRVSGFPNLREDVAYKDFNSEPRHVQLNIIMMALNELHKDPMLPGEHWSSVGNPFLLGPNITEEMSSVSKAIEKKHRISVVVRENQFILSEKGLADASA